MRIEDGAGVAADSRAVHCILRGGVEDGPGFIVQPIPGIELQNQT